jgi:hypothetical protein
MTSSGALVEKSVTSGYKRCSHTVSSEVYESLANLSALSNDQKLSEAHEQANLEVNGRGPFRNRFNEIQKVINIFIKPISERPAREGLCVS